MDQIKKFCEDLGSNNPTPAEVRIGFGLAFGQCLRKGVKVFDK